MPFWGALKGKKTYVVGVIGLIGAIASYLTGDMTAAQAANTALLSLMGMTLKHGQQTGA